MFLLTVNILCLLAQLGSGQNNVTSVTRRSLVDELLKDYDDNMTPGQMYGQPTLVSVQLYLRNMDSFDETAMSFRVTLFLRMWWTDPRLSFKNYPDISEPLELSAKVMDKFWFPDLYFTNERTAHVHDVIVPNRLMHVYRNGTVRSSVRLTMTLGCQMDLHYYPFDSQICHVEAESYALTTASLIFNWYKKADVVIPPDMLLTQFDLVKVETCDCTDSYGTAERFTCLRANIHLSRDHRYFILQVYVPSTLIVLLSWVSFFLNVDAVPARISLGVLTVLALTTLSSTLQASLTRANYIKALDAWVVMCLCFVFVALLEFAVVNVLSRQKKTSHLVKTELQSVSNLVSQMDINLQQPPACKKKSLGKQKALLLDKFSRVFFPVVFLVFNAVYWLVYYKGW